LDGAPHPQSSRYFKNDLLWPPAKLIYFRDPIAPRSPIGVFGDNGTMLYNFPRDKFRIVSSKKCVYPDCTFVVVEEEQGSMPQESTFILHTVGFAGIMCIYNLGHLLFDTMFPLFLAQLRLGIRPKFDFQLMSIASCGQDVNCAEGTSLEPKFGPIFSKHRLTTAIESYKEGLKTATHDADNGYLCFKEVIVGNNEFLGDMGRNDVTLHHFRNFIFHNLKIDPTWVPKTPLILLFYKEVSKNDLGRGLLNIKEVEIAMKLKFGDSFQKTTFKELSAYDQLKLLQRTTVFITPGSGGAYLSFIMSRGTVHIQFDVLDDNLNSNGYDLFLFTQLNQILLWRYSVDASEYRIPPNHASYAGEYVLNTTRLVEMTEMALRELQQNKEHYF